MKQIVLDAGPLIALFYAKDTYHAQCVAGFRQLIESNTLLLTPLPIIFEVYKWLLQRTTSKVAQQTLLTMNDSLHILTVDAEAFSQLQTAIAQLPQWKGSLEDATVMLTGLQYGCPVWTYNFRDFSIFSSLEFWNPESL
ncbi:MAG: type II toxin-antitoxin system VapC family toxin [Cyanobacteria bacterium J06626_14]